jgi:hypothetical protein
MVYGHMKIELDVITQQNTVILVFSFYTICYFKLLSLFDTMLNFVENLLENERDPRSGPMNDQDHSLSLSDTDRSLVLSHFLTNFLQNLASCQTGFT